MFLWNVGVSFILLSSFSPKIFLCCSYFLQSRIIWFVVRCALHNSRIGGRLLLNMWIWVNSVSNSYHSVCCWRVEVNHIIMYFACLQFFPSYSTVFEFPYIYEATLAYMRWLFVYISWGYSQFYTASKSGLCTLHLFIRFLTVK